MEAILATFVSTMNSHGFKAGVTVRATTIAVLLENPAVA